MGFIRSGHGHQVNAVVPGRFCIEHLLPVSVGTGFSKSESFPIFPAALRIHIQGPCRKFELSIKFCPNPVGKSDLASFPATDQTPV